MKDAAHTSVPTSRGQSLGLYDWIRLARVLATPWSEGFLDGVGLDPGSADSLRSTSRLILADYADESTPYDWTDNNVEERRIEQLMRVGAGIDERFMSIAVEYFSWDVATLDLMWDWSMVLTNHFQYTPMPQIPLSSTAYDLLASYATLPAPSFEDLDGRPGDPWEEAMNRARPDLEPHAIASTALTWARGRRFWATITPTLTASDRAILLDLVHQSEPDLGLSEANLELPSA